MTSALFCLTDGESQRNGKFRAPYRSALHRDPAAHHIHQTFRDGHAEPRALYLADGGGPLSGKLFKNVLLELLTHADAVILDVEFKIGKACRSRILLYNPQADLPTVRRELHGA